MRGAVALIVAGVVVVAGGCEGEKKKEETPATTTALKVDESVRRVSVETCERVAERMARLGSTRAKDVLVRFCVETSVPAEAECLLAAKDAKELIACERWRRQVPEGLLEGDEVTREDCELFYFRLRQFRILEGVDPAAIDQDREQIVRKCEDEARPGTLVCFIAAHDYETARRCP